MPDIYVRSTDGVNTDNGSTWALAKADLHTATTGGLAAAGAGGTCYVSQAHSQSTGAAITLTSPGTKDNPTRIIGCSDAAQPPTTVAETAVVATSGSFALTVNGSLYCYGITFRCAVGGGSSTFVLATPSTAADIQSYEKCSFEYAGTGASAFLVIGNTTSAESSVIRWKDCTAKFAAAGQYITVATSLDWEGGSVLTGNASTAKLFKGAAGRPSVLRVRDVDFSNLATTCPLIDATATLDAIIRNCKLPVGWTGGLITGTPVSLFRASMYNCDAGDTNYTLWIEDSSGAIRDETTIVRSGGATDGVTPIAWKMTSNANANAEVAPLASDRIAVWNTAIGAAKTVTVEVVHDSLTALTDAELWLEVEYLGTSGVPLGSVTSDKRATPLTAPAAQTASTTTWTTTGLTNPNKQKLSVTITPQEAGFISARVCLGKASYTVYVDPDLTVS